MGKGRCASNRVVGPSTVKLKSPLNPFSFLLGLVVMKLALSYNVPLCTILGTLAFLRHLPKSIRSALCR